MLADCISFCSNRFNRKIMMILDLVNFLLRLQKTTLSTKDTKQKNVEETEKWRVICVSYIDIFRFILGKIF